MSLSAKIHIRNKNNSELLHSNLTLNRLIKRKENINDSLLNFKNKSIIDDSNMLSPIENKKNNFFLMNNYKSNTLLIKKNHNLNELMAIYDSIINKIDLLMNSFYKNSYHHIYCCLIKIKNTITKIICDEKTSNSKSKSGNKNKKEILKKKNYNYLFKDNNNINTSKNKKIFISELPYNKNKLSKNSIASIKKNFGLNESIEPKGMTDNNTRKIKYLRKKLNNLEQKFKIDELNYLFCIGEQQKKITELEKQLNFTNVDNMPKEELKKIRCFPNYMKFDINDENKSRNNLLKNKSCNSLKSGKLKKINFFEPNNNNVNNNDNNKDKDNNNDNNNYNNDDDNNKQSDNEIDIDKCNINNIIKNYKEKENDFIKKTKETIEFGKMNFNKQDSFVKKFFEQKKNFFISHPKLNYIKYGSEGFHMKTWKINDIMETLPKKLSNYKFSSKSQKNALVIFPSSLNETMVNLEKLRVNKNFRSIEIKFEEERKLNK